jgi:3-deoxy-manno-octulosonate cytidylyltransferase (CMP-KDO synthetase)
MYGYRAGFLQDYVNLPESGREKSERLEQLRALDGGYKIIIGETDLDSVSVDVPDDIEKVEKFLHGRRRFG